MFSVEINVCSRSGITSSKKENYPVITLRDESNLRSNHHSCFDQAIIWTKSNQGKTTTTKAMCFEAKPQNLCPCSPKPYNKQMGKTTLQIFLQQDSYCPVVKPHSGKISVIEAHERKNLPPRNWCLKVPWAAPGRGYLHPTSRDGDAEMLQPDCPLVASRTTGAGTPILLCHWLAEGLQVSLGPLPCIIWLPTCKAGRETNRAPCYGAHCYLRQTFRVHWVQKQLRAIHFWSH